MVKARNDAEDEAVIAFVARWKNSGGAERANYTSFLTELCTILGVESPYPSSNDPERDEYVFERAVTFRHLTTRLRTGRIDLYKRNAFVLEAKQGIECGEALPARVQGANRIDAGHAGGLGACPGIG
jgi:hypothetical protein